MIYCVVMVFLMIFFSQQAVLPIDSFMSRMVSYCVARLAEVDNVFIGLNEGRNLGAIGDDIIVTISGDTGA